MCEDRHVPARLSDVRAVARIVEHMAGHRLDLLGPPDLRFPFLRRHGTPLFWPCWLAFLVIDGTPVGSVSAGVVVHATDPTGVRGQATLVCVAM